MTTACANKKQKSAFVNHSDPGRILNLVVSLTDDNCKDLQVKVNTYFTEQCEAELVFQVIVNTERKEAFIETVGVQTLERKYKFNMTKWMLDKMECGPTCRTDFLNRSENIQELITSFLKDDNPKRRIVMMPLDDKPFSLLLCVVAPKIMEESIGFLMEEGMAFCWPVLKKAIMLEYELSVKQNCQQLLKVARNLFTRVGSLPTLMKMAMSQAKRLTMAEHCRVLMIDIEAMQLYEVFKDRSDKSQRYAMNVGIAGKVLETGRLINVKDVNTHPDYRPEIDCCPGINCRSILWFPIRDSSGIIGLGQLINKIDDLFFDAMDEELALGFSVYCGVSLIHSMMYEKIQEAHVRNTLANELLMYHLKVDDSEVNSLITCTGYHGQVLDGLFFNHRIIPLRELPCYVFKMFHDLGFIQRFNLKEQKVVRFILQVKKGYRDVPYHCWTHAFNTAQWAYSAIRIFKLVSLGYLSDLHALMYFVAALTHDLDHRGTTSSYQIQGHTSLAALYSSEGSVLERHHLTQALCVLNADGCDILDSLPRRDYDRALIMLRDNIIATDISNFMQHIKDYKLIANVYQKNNRAHLSALQAVLMNCADLCDMIKDWDSYKKSSVLILSEFFSRGDEEKNKGLLPIMDKTSCLIPELEMNFINSICLPLYNILKEIIPHASECTVHLHSHLEKWEAAQPLFSEVPLLGGLAVLQNPELDDMIEFNIKENERLRIEAEEQRLREEAEKLLEQQRAEEKAAAKRARN